MSTHPATPHRAKLGSAQFASVEQHASPLGTANRHLSTAALRLSLSNGTFVATVSLAHAQTHATSSAAEEARPSRGSGMKTVTCIKNSIVKRVLSTPADAFTPSRVGKP